MGAWIEIIISKAMKKADESLLSWERGLKLPLGTIDRINAYGRSSRGSVD